MIGFTEIFIIATVSIVLLVDLFLAYKGIDQTISAKIAFWSMRYPIVAALLGLLLGHLTWPNCTYCR